MEKSIKGLVIKESDFKENDVVLTICNESGLSEIIAKGLKKIGAKNRAACQLFTISEFIVAYPQEKARGVLTTGSVIHDFQLSGNLQAIAMMSVAAEVTCRFFRQENAYPQLVALAESLSTEGNYWLEFCWLIKNWIVSSGIMPEVSGCHKCGKKLIVGLSFNGGFVCQDCFESYDLHYNKEELKLISYLFKAGINDKPRLLKEKYSWQIADFLMQYLTYHQPMNLKSWEFLKQVVRL